MPCLSNLRGGLLGGLRLKIGDDVSAIFGLFQTGKDHLRAGNKGFRILKKFLRFASSQNKSLLSGGLHSRRICVARTGASLRANQVVLLWTYASFCPWTYRVANFALPEHLLAMRHIGSVRTRGTNKGPA